MTDTLILFAITEFFLSLSPGPAVLLVVSTSLNRGFRPSTGSILGILSVNALYFSLSAIGVGAIIAASPSLALGLKVTGCLYLAFTALQIIREVRAQDGQGEDGTPACSIAKSPARTWSLATGQRVSQGISHPVLLNQEHHDLSGNHSAIR